MNKTGIVSTLWQAAPSPRVPDTWWKGGKTGGRSVEGLEWSSQTWGVLVGEDQVGQYWILSWGRGRTPTSPRLLIPLFSESPPLEGKHPLPTFLPGSPPSAVYFHFPGPEPICSEFGKAPPLLPPSCSLGAGSWCVTFSHVPLPS